LVNRNIEKKLKHELDGLNQIPFETLSAEQLARKRELYQSLKQLKTG
jgi:hypothetical protein